MKDHEQQSWKSNTNYMAVLPKSLVHKVCKIYLSFVVTAFDILEILYGFVHEDKQIYPLVIHLVLKYNSFYFVIPMLEVSYQL